MKFKYAAIVAPAALMLTAAASAQTTNNNYYQANPFSVRIGAGYLTDSTARDAVGNLGLAAGLGYDLPFKGIFGQAGERGSIDLDYLGFWRNGNRFNNIGLSYIERVPFSTGTGTNGAGSTTVYGGLGVGVWFDDASGGGASDNRTTVGGTALLGVGFDQRYSLELAYNFREKFHDVSPNSFSLRLGYHF